MTHDARLPPAVVTTINVHTMSSAFNVWLLSLLCGCPIAWDLLPDTLCWSDMFVWQLSAQNLITSVLPEAAQMIWHRTKRPAVPLHQSHPSSHRVYLSSVALEPHHYCTDKGAWVAAAGGDENFLSRQRLFIIAWDGIAGVKMFLSQRENSLNGFAGGVSCGNHLACATCYRTNRTQRLWQAVTCKNI